MTYVSLANLTPITFFLFAISISGLLVASNDMADKYKEALAVSALSILMLFGTLYNSKEINLLHNSLYKSEGAQPVRDIICLANPKCMNSVKDSPLSKYEEILTKDPVTYVEETMAKLDMKLNEYERVNLKALEIYAKGNSEFSDERINLFKQEITDLKTSNYKSNFIRLTLAANTFSLETCNKYNSTAFCADLADLTIPQIEMSETIKLGIIENTGLLNEEKTEKYLDIFYDKLDKALDKRPDRVLTYREVNNIFESIPTKQQ